MPENTVFTLTVTATGKNNTGSVVREYNLISKIIPERKVVLDTTQLGYVTNEIVKNNNIDEIIHYVVKGTKQNLSFVEDGFDSDSIVAEVYPLNSESKSPISNADKYKTIQPDGKIYYNFVFDTSNLDYGQIYTVKFTTTATTNGISNVISAETKIKIVDCYYKDISFAKIENANPIKYSSDTVPYGGYKTYIITATKVALVNGVITETTVSTDNSNSDEILKNLLSNTYISIGNDKVVDLTYIQEEDKNKEIRVYGNLIDSTTITIKCGYTYNNGQFAFTKENGLNNYNDTTLSITVEIQGSMDNPIPIENDDQFNALRNITSETQEENRHFILMKDIVLEDFKPMDLNILSLDGNNKIIYIKSFDLSDYSDLNFVNIGVFNTIGADAVLKNVHISLAKMTDNLGIYTENSNGDLTKYPTVNLGLFAVTNNGILNNCMLSTIERNRNENDSYNDSMESVNLQFITSNENVTTSNFSLFINTNNGNITNCAVNDKTDLTYMAGSSSLITLNAPGKLSGFVGTNNGVISSSSAKCFTLNNTSVYSDSTITAGFVGVNSNNGRVSFSYANGFGKLDTEGNSYSLDGSALKSNGAGAGFVFTNRGKINDCYSNISIRELKAQAGGFVYQNYESGTISDCVSASLTTQNSTSSSLFCAKDNLKRSLNAGTFNYCYVYAQTGNIYAITDNDAGLYVLSNDKFEKASSYHFSCGNNLNWSMVTKDNTKYGPFITIANKTISRTRILNNSTQQSNSTENNSQVDYTYSYIDVVNNSYGESAENPFIISSAIDFNKVINYIVENSKKNSDTKFKNKYFLFVNDIDLTDNNILTSTTSKETFSGKIDGNGFAIKNISIINNNSEDGGNTSIGLFSIVEQINKGTNNPKSNSVVSNIELNIDEVTATKNTYVGALAGQIENTTINNVKITAAKQSSAITGKNIVGGLVGLSKNSQIYNSTNTAVSVIAEYSHANVTTATSNEGTYSISDNNNYDSYSYAGGIVGVSSNNSSINKLTVQGNIQIRAENAGGVVGYLSNGSTLNDAEFIAQYNQLSISNLQGIFGLRNSGGIVAHSAGTIENVRVVFAPNLYSVADAMAQTTSSTEVGLNNLFAKANYRTGGLVGYLTGGKLSYSYSRVAVTNSNSYIAGGIIGEATGGTLSYVYTTGNVYAGREIQSQKPHYAGLIGVVNNGSGVTITNCYAYNRWQSADRTKADFNAFANGSITTATDNNNDYIDLTKNNDYVSKISGLKDKLKPSNAFEENTLFPRLNLYKN